MLRGGITLDKDAQRIEMERDQAVSREGKRFISLRLLDHTKNRIHGAHVLFGTPYLDAQTNIRKFHFEERGGQLVFQTDEYRGGQFCNMYDCEHNRKFLASMLSENFWEIEDEAVLADIKIRAANIKARALTEIPVIDEPKEKKLSDTELESEMARLEAEKSRRTLQKNELDKKPVRKILEKPEEEAASPEDTVDQEVNPETLKMEEVQNVNSETPKTEEVNIAQEPKKRKRRARRSLVTVEQPS